MRYESPWCQRNAPECKVRGLPGLAFYLCLCLLPSLAADKSGVSPNTISLPKGPGSIEGLGESFQPSLNTGTAHYSIGFKVPPGTAGHSARSCISAPRGGGDTPR